MNTVITDRGPFSDAALEALFVDNRDPTRGEIQDAIHDAQIFGDAAERLVAKRGLLNKTYAHRQPVFGPIVRMLALAGWTLSGNGYFSVAFHKGGLALKIGLKGKDDAAREYLEWVRDQGNLPGLPTLYALGTNDLTYVALMDRYEAIAGEVDDDDQLYEPSIAMEYDEVKAGVECGVSGVFPIAATAVLIHQSFAHCEFDIHPGNVMLDRRRRMVITDPVGMSSRDAKRDSASYSGYTYEVAMEAAA